MAIIGMNIPVRASFQTGDPDWTIGELGKRLEQYRVTPARVGLARAFAMNGNGVVSCWPNRPEWEGFAVVDALCNHVVRSGIYDLDDGQAAALGEAHLADAGDRLAVIAFGTGLAIGICEGGWSINIGNGAEVPAHWQMPGFHEECSCGSSGCLQLALTPVHGEPQAELFVAALDYLVCKLHSEFACSKIVFSGGRLLSLRSLIYAWDQVSDGIHWHFSQWPQDSSLAGAIVAANPSIDAPTLFKALLMQNETSGFRG